MVANVASLANHDTGAVINEEVMADLGSRVNVDAGLFVRPLGHHTWNKRHTHLVEFMRQPMDRDGLQPRIAKDDFILVLASRIAVIGSLNIRRQELSKIGQAFQKVNRHGLTFGFIVNLFNATVNAFCDTIFVMQRTRDLRC